VVVVTLPEQSDSTELTTREKVMRWAFDNKLWVELKNCSGDPDLVVLRVIAPGLDTSRRVSAKDLREALDELDGEAGR
jgi:hypothetical protein